MRSYSLIAPAKINLYLEIIGDRTDGYHELAMVMQSIDLADQVDIIGSGDERMRVHCQSLEVPNDKTNLAYRAAELMAKNFPDAFAKYGGVDITIHKHIPVAAGLAGGSTNAAAVLVGIDLLWNLGLTQIEIEELGASLGSDVPFCIRGGTAIATGRGEQLSPILGLENVYIVLGKHKNLAVSTPWAYKSYRTVYGDTYIRDKGDLAVRANAVHSAPMVQAIIHRDIPEICQRLHNDLEKVVLPEYSQVSQLRTAFTAAGALGTMMSGSGPSVFAICESKVHAESIQQQISQEVADKDLELFITKFISHGIQVLSPQ
ncbi:4-(cytidine 5'-diphospho)-2-C-methyl-D-erythritol kinase [Calothrix sp. UHCC 0171]|uniref:4-(cytidine 5'-diphospho)-2-C-methyl-D-erythritol kinase n=1 Tax=Calothrix sp. UHCC 0171 TaxID=3110245 RepID=UPI002B2014D4|nr:4-(cytidine 5'-diphospho)-2-C-methyl-D-erythritol kinase [Calothrix sp. UHCC 0171]MEA5571240.1 4-(cytidine 5'-diphospho)-2-C-methyl-D-erythritol kinase [Calothrix sp. UHCC 0171]